MRQMEIGNGETIGLVMLGSDKTQLTDHQGDKACYAVYLSSGNLDKSIRSKSSAECWVMVGQIPIAHWDAEEKDARLFTRRLHHACMEIITERRKGSRKACPDLSSTLAFQNPNTRFLEYVAMT